MAHLTAKLCKAARYTGDGKEKDIRWDDDPRGLGLRVFPSNTKTFVLFYRTAGRTQRLHTIGTYGSPWTLAAARTEAKRLLLAVERELADPVAERKHRGIEARTGM